MEKETEMEIEGGGGGRERERGGRRGFVKKRVKKTIGWVKDGLKKSEWWSKFSNAKQRRKNKTNACNNNDNINTLLISNFHTIM